MRRRSLGVISVLLLSLLAITGAASAQAPAEHKLVTAVRVENNRSVSVETVLSRVKTKVGDVFSQEVLNDDLKRLYALDYFSDVSVDVKEESGGVAVTFVLEEKPVIGEIAFRGNVSFRAEKLKSVIKSKPDDMLNPTQLADDVAAIRDFYQKKGYSLVEVTYKIDVDRPTNKAVITIAIDEKLKVKVVAIAVTGNKAIATGAIRKVMATKTAWWFIIPGTFKEDVFQEDLEKIKALYDDSGYLDAEVRPAFTYGADGQSMTITLNVTEGEQYKVGELTVKGNLVLPEKDIQRKIVMKSGKPFSNRGLRDDVNAVRQHYYDYGYMNVLLDVERTLNPTTGKIDIAYTIDARELVYVGKVTIRGNAKTKDIVVRRELRVYPGEKFSGERLKKSKERLYNLGYFENVAFDTEPTAKENVKDLVVDVKESKTGEFSFGGGYSSIDLLMGFVEIQQRNFDIMNFPTFMGGGQNLTIKAEVGMVRTNFNIGWTDPWIFGYPYLFGFDLYRAGHKKSGDVGWSFDETRTGGDLRFGKEFTDHFRGDMLYRLEEVKIENIDDNSSQDMKNEAGSNVISSLTPELTYDTRDNIYAPTRGIVASVAVQDAGGFLMGDKNFYKFMTGVTYYHTFFEKLTLELKGRGGFGNAYGKSDDIPIYERFYAGGQNTIRGYKERHVGPRDPGSAEPIGGESMLIGNAELTFPVYEKLLKAAVFYDVGNVWRRAEDFIVGGDYRSGAGIGVRVNTPVGPVRIDYGYPLVANYDDDRTGEFYFSMSRGF